MNISVELDEISSSKLFDSRIFCEWLTTAQAATYLGISANALRIRVHRGQIKVSGKLGRNPRFRLDDLRRALLKKGA